MGNVTNDKALINSDYKADALDFILANSFKSGFGTLSKTELDLILFTAVLKFSEDKRDSDFELSKYLQVTQQRIRNLKEKASVKYLTISRDEAIKQFIKKCDHAKVEEFYIDIPINNIAIKNEIEGLLDENHILMHYQLNPKIFRMRMDDFYTLSIILETSSNQNLTKDEVEKKVIAAMKNKIQSDDKLKAKLKDKGLGLTDLTSTTIKQTLVKTGFSLGIDLLASVIPGGAFLSGPAKSQLESVQSQI